MQFGQNNFQSSVSHEFDLLKMMERTHLNNEFKNQNNPYNLYHSKLMLRNIFDRINSHQEE
jgi:hypothetical protein